MIPKTMKERYPDMKLSPRDLRNMNPSLRFAQTADWGFSKKGFVFGFVFVFFFVILHPMICNQL